MCFKAMETGEARLVCSAALAVLAGLEERRRALVDDDDIYLAPPFLR